MNINFRLAILVLLINFNLNSAIFENRIQGYNIFIYSLTRGNLGRIPSARSIEIDIKNDEIYLAMLVGSDDVNICFLFQEIMSKDLELKNDEKYEFIIYFTMIPSIASQAAVVELKKHTEPVI